MKRISKDGVIFGVLCTAFCIYSMAVQGGPLLSVENTHWLLIAAAGLIIGVISAASLIKSRKSTSKGKRD